jgi:hypothetical protein
MQEGIMDNQLRRGNEEWRIKYLDEYYKTLDDISKTLPDVTASLIAHARVDL